MTFPSAARITALALAAALTAPTAFAAQRTIVDSDHNGLIEINDLQDLNEIRNNPAANSNELRGTHLYGNNEGCPPAAAMVMS